MAKYRILGGGLLMVVALAAGCGGTDTEAEAAGEIATLETDVTIGDEQAAASEPEEAIAEDDVPAEEVTREDAQLDFSKCVRENGYEDFPDIAGGNIRQALQESGVDFRDPEFREVMETCQEVLADAGFARAERTPEEQAAAQEQQLEIAACLRDNGYPGFPDPDPDAGGGRRGFGGEALTEAGIDPRDPEFREAIEVCRTELGIEGGGRDGAGQGAGGRQAGTTGTSAPAS